MEKRQAVDFTYLEFKRHYYAEPPETNSMCIGKTLISELGLTKIEKYSRTIPDLFQDKN